MKPPANGPWSESHSQPHNLTLVLQNCSCFLYYLCPTHTKCHLWISENWFRCSFFTLHPTQALLSSGIPLCNEIPLCVVHILFEEHEIWKMCILSISATSAPLWYSSTQQVLIIHKQWQRWVDQCAVLPEAFSKELIL